MRRIPVRFWALALVLIALNCGAWWWVRREIKVQMHPELRPATVVAALPRQNVDAAERLSIVFDGPVVDAAKVGQIEDAPPFKISPNVSGEWTWSTDKQLDFVLDDPLPPGQVFDIDPLSDIEVKLGRPVAIAEKINFQTRELNLDQCRLVSSDRESVQLELLFNQKVAPGDLMKHLKVQVPQAIAAAPRPGVFSENPSPEFQALAPTCLTVKPETRLVIRIDRPRATEIQVVLTPELKGFQAEKGLGQITRRAVHLPRSLAYLRTDIDQPGLDASIPVRFRFSESLNRSQTLPPISVTPPVKGLSTHVNNNWGASALVLQGEFTPGANYVATVGKVLLAENGQTLPNDIEITFTIPQREPMVRFGMADGILSPKGNLTLDVETVNVGHVRIRAQRIHANNLVQFLHDGHRYRADQLTRTVVEKTLAISGAGSEPRKHVLDLRQTLEQKEPLGTYLLEVRATDQSWERDYATVVVTDLGMIIKQDHDSVWVWVSSLKSAEPVAGVRVSALSSNNQTLVTAITGADGVARLPVDAKHPDGAPWVVVAEHDQDMVYQLLGRQQWVQDHIDQSGRPHPSAYEVMLYPERGVYRPGDTVHLTGMIRDQAGSVPTSFPLEVKVTRPDGRVAATINVTPVADQQGTFQFDFPTRDDSQTGPFAFAVTLPGAAEILGKTDVLVESFVPARIEVQAEPSSPKFGPKETAKLIVRGRYFFGQPAAELPLTVHGSYQYFPYRSKSAPDFHFQSNVVPERRMIELTDLKLDPQGQRELDIAVPPESPRGIWKANVTATVTEPGGRSLSRNATLNWDTAERHIGVRVPQNVAVNQDIPVEFIQLTAADSPAVPGAVRVKLNQVEYDTVQRRTNGMTEWISNIRETLISEQMIPGDAVQDGIGKLTVKCPSSGHFRLEVRDLMSNQSTEFHLYARSRDNEYESLALDKPEQLELVLDQVQYKPGSVAKVVVKSPFVGTLVLCVESNRILDQRIIKMTENTVALEIPIPANLRGGAFLTAAVVRPIVLEEKTWLPHRAMGLARLVTDHSDHELPIQIEAPSEVRPSEAVTVFVQTPKPEAGHSKALVHLWAVDEGVLSATAFDTPNPQQLFFGQRILGVSTQDVYASLLPDHQRPVDWSRIGGDGEGHEVGAARRSLVPPKKIESVVLWQGLASVDDAGRAKFDFQLPNFTGELRFMAIAVNGDQYGSTDKPLTVNSPLMLEANWPRFTAPGDVFRVPVKLFNSTDAPLSVQLNLKVEGPVVVTLPPETGDISLPPRSPVTVWLPVRGAGMGTANVTLQAISQSPDHESLKSEQTTNLPVRPGLPLHSISMTLKGAVGTPLDIPIADEFESGTATTILKISPQPALEFLPAVDSLLEYPYGCVEQTTSRLWALLTAHEILGQNEDKFGRRAVLDQMLAAGIHRLWAMQTPRGGLGYWPGDRNDHQWGTIYAAEFLAEATQRGIPVDSQFKTELLAFLVEILHERNGNTSTVHAKAQICNVLARFQRPEEGWMSRLSEQPRFLDMESRAELAQAWNAAGRKDKALQILTDDILEQNIKRQYEERITSPTQQTATLLCTLLEIDADHPWIPRLVSRLLEIRRNGQWGNTAENARALRALVRFQGANSEPTDYTGTIAGTETQSMTFNSQSEASFTLLAQRNPLHIETTGKGPYFVSATTSGVMKAGFDQHYDRQIQVRRVWLDRHDQPINLGQVRVGDLISVQVTLRNTLEGGFNSIPNVAIVDALPAGFEVESPRLMTSEQNAGAGENREHPAVADHLEFLDDRVVLFAKSQGYPQTFRYTLRAVTVGRFAAPPIQASCMYDADVASVNGGGVVEVQE